MSPPSILIPQAAHASTLDIYGRSGRQHFMSQKEFDKWSVSHPSEKLRPAVNGDDSAAGSGGTTPNKGKEVEKKEYKAPNHPVSHLLHTIPPRAPSRSSRSNILSYTLHLATSTRLATYSSRASYDEEDALEEQKASGLYKLSGSLLKASRRDAALLPKSVERRVTLAALVEELLSAPDKEKAVKRISEGSTISSGVVEAVLKLKPLTSPDTTRLFETQTGSGVKKSVAQSLIDLKFAGEEDVVNEKGGPSGDRSGETVFNDPSSRLTATPHMDYRIVRGQAMRNRAKEIFSTSILPSNSTAWCRRHRERGCSTCPIISHTGPNPDEQRWSRSTLPGQGLSGGSAKRSLTEVLPAFLTFSASLLKDLQERASSNLVTDALEYTINNSPDIAEVNINVTATWYELLHSLIIQAALEGYLVDGWTGTEGLETLFGVGCGVWEGRGWAQRMSQKEPLPVTPRLPRSERMDILSDESDSDEEEEEERERELLAEREKERDRLVEAAQALFGTRDVAQADFERSMRDRVHEFLAVPEEGDLQTHLVGLNAKYPLASFERSMVDFLEATTRLLGKPSLAKLEPATTPVGAVPVSSEPDPYALTQFFSRTESDSPDPEELLERSKGKRRRMD